MIWFVSLLISLGVLGILLLGYDAIIAVAASSTLVALILIGLIVYVIVSGTAVVCELISSRGMAIPMLLIFLAPIIFIFAGVIFTLFIGTPIIDLPSILRNLFSL